MSAFLVMVDAMVSRLHRITSSSSLAPMHQRVHMPCSGSDHIKCAWLLLLNVDMATKELLLEPSDPVRQCAALGLTRDQASRVPRMLSMMRGVDAGKARRFFCDLREDLVPRWLENEVLGPSDLVRQAMALYLNS